MTKFDREILDILHTFGIPSFEVQRQIQKQDLGYPSTGAGEHLEFNLIARVHRTGLIIEATIQKARQREEITKFARHCREFVQSTMPIRDRIRLFPGIARKERDALCAITDWKYVYIGTSPEIVTNRLDGGICPGDPLYVLNREHYEYIRYLSKRIGEFGKYEFLKGLEISPAQAGESDLSHRPDAICLASRKISKGMPAVDIFAFSMPVSYLLRIARVVRYGSIDSWLPEIGTEAYQRLLNPDKLKRIREFLKSEKGESSFPNAITVVLSRDVAPTDSGVVTKLVIPIVYGSIEVIDGQHRLFAFSSCGLKPDQLERAKILVVGLRFRDAGVREQQQWSAKTFIEINRSQTKVPTELIQLIAHSVMGERTPMALAARVLVDLNIRARGPLRDVFHTRPFQKHNRVGGSPVRLVTVTKELAPLFDVENRNRVNMQGVYEALSNDAWTALSRGRTSRILSESSQIVSEYFGWVSRTFAEDWKSKDSLIFTSKYIAAFCKLLVEFKKRRLPLHQITSSLVQSKVNIIAYLAANSRSLGPKREVFWKGNAVDPLTGGGIPAARSSFVDIYDFLRRYAGLP